MAKLSRAQKIASGVLILALVAGFGFSSFAIKNTASKLSEEVSRASDAASLASKNLDYDYSVSVPVDYFDQVSDPCENYYDRASSDLGRAFEWSSCGYSTNAIQSGLVSAKLGENSLPVAAADSLVAAKSLGFRTEDRGVNGESFARWFSAVPEKSEARSSTLTLKYSAEDDSFSFGSANFYPLDGSIFSDGDISPDGHNHLFSLALELPFAVSGGELFEFTADDDTWIFVNDDLVLDFAGIHSSVPAYFYLDENCEIHYSVNNEPDVAGPTLEKGSLATVRIFHADRDSASSVFTGEISYAHLSVVDAVIASAEEGNSETDENGDLAFDASDYVAPLGESTDVSGAATRATLTSLIVEVTILGILLVLTPVIVRIYMKRSSRK